MTSSPCDGELWIVFSHYKTTPARVVIYGILYSNFRKYFPMAECRLMIWHHDALRGSEVRWNLREGFKMISMKDYIYSSAVPTLSLLSHRRIWHKYVLSLNIKFFLWTPSLSVPACNSDLRPGPRLVRWWFMLLLTNPQVSSERLSTCNTMWYNTKIQCDTMWYKIQNTMW